MTRAASGIAIAIAAIILDQASKQAALAAFVATERVSVLPLLDMTLAWNRGVSFGFFGAGGIPPWAFVAVSLAIAGFLAVLMWRAETRIAALGYGCILGGALGNVIDRCLYGAVVDFILLYWRTWSFPVFNVADMSITLGVGLILIDSLWPGRASTTS